MQYVLLEKNGIGTMLVGYEMASQSFNGIYRLNRNRIRKSKVILLMAYEKRIKRRWKGFSVDSG